MVSTHRSVLVLALRSRGLQENQEQREEEEEGVVVVGDVDFGVSRPSARARR